MVEERLIERLIAKGIAKGIAEGIAIRKYRIKRRPESIKDYNNYIEYNSIELFFLFTLIIARFLKSI